MGLTEEFGKAFIPEKFRPIIRRYFAKAAIYSIPYSFFGYLFYLSLLISFFLYTFVWSTFQRYSPIKLAVATFGFWFVVELLIALLIMAAIYIYIDIQIFRRAKEIEQVLPDFLNVVSENLKTGMTIDQALWGAIKPEFGVLAKEIQIAAKKVATGDDVGHALAEFANKYNSPIVKRAIILIIEGVQGGGQVADTIDRTVDNIRRTSILKKTLLANAVNYVIFISIIVMFISPGLFALAYVLLSILQGFAFQLGESATVTSFFSFTDIAVALDDFKLFSQLAVSAIALFASMIISNISKGDIRSGAKYIPVYVGVALLIYTIMLNVLVAAFAGLFSN